MARLEKGMPAPDFDLEDGDGNRWKLSDLRGKKVIVYFYPADDTPGCTAEACDFRDSHGDLENAGYVVLGISPQGAESKRAFASKHSLNFPLLIDEGGMVADSYGVWGEQEIWNNRVLKVNRSTFVVDENGVIEQAMYGVKPRGHVERLKEKLGV